MKVIVVAIALGLMGLLLFVFIGNEPSDNTPQERKLSMETIQSDVKLGAKLIDVRTREEYSAGHIEGAANTPLLNFESGYLPENPKDTKLYLYCHSGNRAGQVKNILEQAGYTNVTNLGGINNVVNLGGKQIK